MSDGLDDMEDINPFGDPSVVRASAGARQQVPPFSSVRQSYDKQNYQPDTDYPSHTDYGGSAGISAELEQFKRKEEDLRMRELELQRRESQMSNMQQPSNKPPNFPPIPSFIPIAPCFYINIDEEIPPQHNMLCKRLYLKLQVYAGMLLLNIIIMAIHLGSDIGSPTVSFVVSIFAALIIIPSSFLCCFRSAYVALKTNSSFYFVFFFVSQGIEIIMHFVQSLGITGNCWGGFINGGTLIDKKYGFRGGITLFLGLGWFILFCIAVYLFLIMHRIYKSAGANLQQAQSEFSAGVWRHGGANLLSAGLGQPT